MQKLMCRFFLLSKLLTHFQETQTPVITIKMELLLFLRFYNIKCKISKHLISMVSIYKHRQSTAFCQETNMRTALIISESFNNSKC